MVAYTDYGGDMELLTDTPSFMRLTVSGDSMVAEAATLRVSTDDIEDVGQYQIGLSIDYPDYQQTCLTSLEIVESDPKPYGEKAEKEEIKPSDPPQFDLSSDEPSTLQLFGSEDNEPVSAISITCENEKGDVIYELPSVYEEFMGAKASVDLGSAVEKIEYDSKSKKFKLKEEAEVREAQFFAIVVELQSADGLLSNLYGFTVNMICVKEEEIEGGKSIGFFWDPDAPQPRISSIS